MSPSQGGVYLMRPWVTVLSMSGGQQSYALWKMIELGVIERPKNLLVMNADPGMEAKGTYAVVDRCEAECAAMGIPFIRVKRNLYQDIMDLKSSGKTRFDNPPFWTKNRLTGKRGRLTQSCTGFYKVAAMDQALRLWMEQNLAVPRNNKHLGSDAVRKWIGFSADEAHRIKEARQEYQFFEYPLVELGWKKADVLTFFLRHNIPIPPRSVCNGCFANDVQYFQEMYTNSPDDWAQAVAVDEQIRDLTCVGITDECYVSWTLVPLKELAAAGFPKIDGEQEQLCHSGHCFV